MTRTGCIVRAAAVLAVVVASVAAQQQPGAAPLPPRFQPQQPGEPLPTPAPQAPGQGPQPSQGWPRDAIDEMTPVWMQPGRPGFSGFPVFPSRLSGYGNYPLPVDPSARPAGVGAAPGAQGPFGLLLPPAAPEPRGWPGWVRAASKQALPFAADRGLLVRLVDRVWWRASADEPFVPMFFHDKFATLVAGGEVRVPQSGEFELLLWDTTRVVARGTTALRLEQTDEREVRVAVGALTWLRIQAGGRQHTFVMPDGSALVVDPPPAAAAAAADAPPPSPALVEFERVDEPGFYGGRATLANLGTRPVTWRHAFGTATLGPSERLTLFLSAPTAPIAAGLSAPGARLDQRDGDVTCRSDGADAELRWCGARFALPPGATIELESLQGNAFPAEAPPAGQ